MSDINEIKKALAESTQGKWEQHEDTVKMGEWMVISTYSKTADAHLIANAPVWLDHFITTIESQKEEIEKLKRALLNAGEYAARGLLDEAELREEIESLKAITELAVKGLKEIACLNVDSAYSAGTFARNTLSEIERLQNE